MSDKPKTLAVLFDLDGTLSDSIPLIRHTYRKVFQELDLPWGSDDVMRWIGRPLQDIAVHFAGKDRAGLFTDRYQHHYHLEHDRYMSLFPGTLEMLKYLKDRSVKTGLVTSKGRPGTVRTVEFTGMAAYLDVIITAHDVEKHKPLPDPVFKALEMIGVEPAEALFVGDSHYDLESGKAAGVRVLAVCWGICPAAELRRYEPEGILQGWDQIKYYL